MADTANEIAVLAPPRAMIGVAARYSRINWRGAVAVAVFLLAWELLVRL